MSMMSAIRCPHRGRDVAISIVVFETHERAALTPMRVFLSCRNMLAVVIHLEVAFRRKCEMESPLPGLYEVGL